MTDMAIKQTPFRRLTTFLLGKPRGRQERLAGLTMTLPAFIFFVIFIGISIVRTVLLGFQKWNAISAPQWVGLDNYIGLLDDAVFHHALFVTLLLTAVLTLFLSTIPLVIAVLFNMGWGAFGTIGRTMLFMPAIISWVVTGALWRMIYDPNIGTLNNWLGQFGLESLQQNWLGDESTVLFAILVVAIWQQIGLYVIIFYAGLQGVDLTLYEAAAIDGANAFQQFLNVTVPLIRPVTLVVITLNLLNGIKLFDVIWVMTQGGPVNASHTLGTAMYRVTFASPGLPQFGYGSALSTVILILCVLAVLFQIWMNRRTNV
jgi:multiple sugar transport system permease protein/raffinose/stachyose/melibiose transport system permease protein